MLSPSYFLSGTVILTWTFLVPQTVKHLSTVWEIWVQSLGWEDPLEKEMAIHSSTIAWKIPWTEEPGRLQSMGLQRVGHDWVTSRSRYQIMWFANISSQSVVYIFFLFTMSLEEQKFLILLKPNLSVFFSFMDHDLMLYLKNFCLTQGYKFFLMFFLQVF